QMAEIHPENWDWVRRNHACAAQQSAVSAQGEQRVELLWIVEARSAASDLVKLTLIVKLESQAGTELTDCVQHGREICVTQVSDDAESNHPAIASLSRSARTRFAMP